MADPAAEWEAAVLVAGLDPGIAARLLAAHPAEGRCGACGAVAPCRLRSLAEAADRAGRPPA